jgi:hypothetical protein
LKQVNEEENNMKPFGDWLNDFKVEDEKKESGEWEQFNESPPRKPICLKTGEVYPDKRDGYEVKMDLSLEALKKGSERLEEFNNQLKEESSEELYLVQELRDLSACFDGESSEEVYRHSFDGAKVVEQEASEELYQAIVDLNKGLMVWDCSFEEAKIRAAYADLNIKVTDEDAADEWLVYFIGNISLSNFSTKLFKLTLEGNSTFIVRTIKDCIDEAYWNRFVEEVLNDKPR